MARSVEGSQTPHVVARADWPGLQIREGGQKRLEADPLPWNGPNIEEVCHSNGIGSAVGNDRNVEVFIRERPRSKVVPARCCPAVARQDFGDRRGDSLVELVKGLGTWPSVPVFMQWPPCGFLEVASDLVLTAPFYRDSDFCEPLDRHGFYPSDFFKGRRCLLRALVGADVDSVDTFVREAVSRRIGLGDSEWRQGWIVDRVTSPRRPIRLSVANKCDRRPPLDSRIRFSLRRQSDRWDLGSFLGAQVALLA